MSKRSPEFLLLLFGIVLLIGLAVVGFAQVRYVDANTIYENHLSHAVLTPRSNIPAELAAEAWAVGQWLRVRTAGAVVAAGAIVGILWQVVRRRNERVASAETAEEA